MIRKILFTLTIILATLTSCQKENPQPNEPAPTPTQTFAEFSLEVAAINQTPTLNSNVVVYFMESDATTIIGIDTTTVINSSGTYDCNLSTVTMDVPMIEGTNYQVKIYEIGGILLAEMMLNVTEDGGYYVSNVVSNYTAPGGAATLSAYPFTYDCGGTNKLFILAQV